MKVAKRIKKITAPVRIGIYIALTVVVVIGLIYFLSYRDTFDNDFVTSIKSFFKFENGDKESAEYILFDEGFSNQFCIYDGKIAILSDKRLVLYDISGKEAFSKTVNMTSPVLDAVGSNVLSYDRGGTGWDVSNGTSVIKSSADQTVLTASANEKGGFVLVTEENSYKALVTVYDPKCNPVYKFYVSDSGFVTASDIAPDGKRLVTSTVRQEGANIITTIIVNKTTEEEPISQIIVRDRLCVQLFYLDDNNICAVFEDGLVFYDKNGEETQDFSIQDQLMLDIAASEDIVILRIGRQRTGQLSQLLVFDNSGKELNSIGFDENVESISVSGKFFSALSGDTLSVFNGKGALMESAGGLSGVRLVIINPAGSFLIVGKDRARWHLY